MSAESPTASAAPRRERWIVLASLAALTALGWAYLWLAPMPMPATSGGLRTAHYVWVTFLMWLIMMIGMMTPSVAPLVLLVDRSARRDSPRGFLRRTVPFVSGYFSAWAAFSALATLLQVELIAAGWIDDMGVARQPLATAVLLAGVALYQWLPAKRACLDHCRTPLAFLMQHFRPGARGAWRMGAHHGFYCIGCCWALMLLLFAGGVMNLSWVAVIAVVVLAEKLWVRSNAPRHLIGAAALAGAFALGMRAFGVV